MKRILATLIFWVCAAIAHGQNPTTIYETPNCLIRITPTNQHAGKLYIGLNTNYAAQNDAVFYSTNNGVEWVPAVKYNTFTNALALKLDLAGGTMSGAINMGGAQVNNMADPLLAQDAATKTYVDAAVDSLFGFIWYGTDTAHATIPGAKQFSTVLPTQWTNTFVLSAGSQIVGSRFFTPTTATQIPAGSYQHEVFCNGSGGGLPSVVMRSDLVLMKADGSVTNLLVTGANYTPTGTIIPHTSTSLLSTNVTVPSGSWCLGVLRYADRTGGAATINIYGGGTTPTHLNGPNLEGTPFAVGSVIGNIYYGTDFFSNVVTGATLQIK